MKNPTRATMATIPSKVRKANNILLFCDFRFMIIVISD